jgi:hypothetical protein
VHSLLHYRFLCHCTSEAPYLVVRSLRTLPLILLAPLTSSLFLHPVAHYSRLVLPWQVLRIAQPASHQLNKITLYHLYDYTIKNMFLLSWTLWHVWFSPHGFQNPTLVTGYKNHLAFNPFLCFFFASSALLFFRRHYISHNDEYDEYDEWTNQRTNGNSPLLSVLFIFAYHD